ncbi:MAG: hypothetical protein KJT03_15890 [Verrucomicrobiae bacterium]|nr:hypothetical protein [Verrucomicrobiae bacterium]
MSKLRFIRVLGISFMVLGVVFAVVFVIPAKTNPDPSVWFTPEYYSQFLPIAISVMLALSGVFLTFRHSKANFNLAVFGHTASEEALFNWTGLTDSALPAWALWLFFLLSVVTLWIAYANILNLKRLSILEALFGICFGAMLVLLPRFI